jgi:hypothetical protein
MAIELATATLPDIHRIYESRIDYIVFLNRDGTGGPTLSGIPKNEAQQWFEQINYWGDSDLREAHRLSLRKLLSAEVFELRYSGFASAVERLESLVDTGS